MILVAMRHAHAAPMDEPSGDHGRPLDTRGRLEAREIGGALASRDLLPDLVLCSDARRARETWERMEGAFGRAIPSLYLPGFYVRGLDSALESLAGVQASTVLVVGHNPDWEHLAFTLTGIGTPMSPATAVVMEIGAPSWRIAVTLAGRWRLRDVVRAI